MALHIYIHTWDAWNIAQSTGCIVGIIRIFANYKKAYGTRGHEAKTLKIKERRNPPLIMQCGANYHQAKNRGRKQLSNPNTDPKTHTHFKRPKMSHVQAKNPGQLSNILPYTENGKTHSDWCSRADDATENRWTVNMPSFNQVVHIIFIVHTIRRGTSGAEGRRKRDTIMREW
jgi:hypothetical protein